MQQLTENLIYQQGSDPEVLLITFTGGYGVEAAAKQFEWLRVSSFYPYSSIFVRDPSKRMCAHGIGGNLDSFDKLLEALREIAQRLNATRIITIGSSAGSFAAILAAHLLKADYCHAFAPHPYCNLKRAILRMDKRMVRQIWATGILSYFTQMGSRKYYDLGNELANTNGHTRYFLHVCRHSDVDYRRAQYLADRPNVNVIDYPCDQHVVPRYLARYKCLDKLFDINNQDRLLEMEFIREARAHN